jgi:DNA-binding XRE family transcriptional regulator
VAAVGVERSGDDFGTSFAEELEEFEEMMETGNPHPRRDPISPKHLALGEAIKDIRKERGVTQAQLREGLHRTWDVIAGIEHGVREESLSTYLTIAQLLGMSLSELLARADF